MGVAELLASAAGRPNAAAALLLADAGVPVFPCVPGAKRPVVAGGFRAATDDGRSVTAWWRRWPDANIGVPTGPASGLEVVDVDRRASGSGFDAFARARNAGLIRGWSALVRTPSGGFHAYFPAGQGRSQPCWQAPRAHVDFRGAGGYVLVPPSAARTPGGVSRPYQVAAGASRSPAVLDAGALRAFLEPGRLPEPRVLRPVGPGESRPRDPGRLASWVAALAEGERNRGLFWAACRLAEAGTDPQAATAALLPAASRAGLPQPEAAATIRSAYRTAAAHAPPQRTAGAACPTQPPGRAL